MKKLFTVFIFFLLLSCNKDSNSVADCKCENPQKNLPWLKELIHKAETDNTGNYKGTIWLLNYEGQDMFVTDMMMGSGGILYYFFDCKGDKTIWDMTTKEELSSFTQKLKSAKVIYTNVLL